MAAERRRPRSAPETAGYYAYDKLDRVLHEKARLGILTALVTRPGGLLFTDLKDLCALTDGNLSRHLQVLQDADMVELWKGHENRRPQTLVRLSRRGRRAFVSYLGELERVLEDAKSRPASSKGEGHEAPPGWVPA